MSRRHTFMRPAVWGIYIVVVLEFLFMISPFALHFYSAYGPALNALHASPATSWLTGFFLPHFSITANPLINWAKGFGFVSAGAGLILFLVGAIQIYGSKLLGRGAVTGGLYRWVPVLGLGVVLIWPRFLVLLSYLFMLFVYYVLARVEEERCMTQYGDSYREYMARTGRIIPVPIRDGSGKPRPLSMAKLVPLAALTLLGGVGAALGIQAYSLSQVTSLYTQDTAVLSPAVLTNDELEEAYRTALTSPELVERLEAAGPEARFVAYVVPMDWFLPDLPLHTEEEIRSIGGGHRTGPFDRTKFKVLFTRARLHSSANGRNIVARAFGRDPILIVTVDTWSQSVLGTADPPEHVIWGDIPTPMI